MQEHYRTNRFAFGLQDEGAVPVWLEMAGVHGAAVEIPVGGGTRLGGHLPAHGRLHFVHGVVFALDIGAPAGPVDLLRIQLGGHKGVPELQRAAALRDGHPPGEEDCRQDEGEQQDDFESGQKRFCHGSAGTNGVSVLCTGSCSVLLLACCSGTRVVFWVQTLVSGAKCCSAE